MQEKIPGKKNASSCTPGRKKQQQVILNKASQQAVPRDALTF